MKNPQIISFDGASPDSVIAIWGENVIDETDQLPLTLAASPITIDIDLFDVTNGSLVATITPVTMTYQSGSKFWTFPISSLAASLTDRHKYVGRVSESTGGTADMKEFYLDEFAVDNDSFEEALIRLPFEVKPYPTGADPMHIVWSDSIGGTAKYKAPAYEGGSGTTAATDPARVTHRGAITTA